MGVATAFSMVEQHVVAPSDPNVPAFEKGRLSAVDIGGETQAVTLQQDTQRIASSSAHPDAASQVASDRAMAAELQAAYDRQSRATAAPPTYAAAIAAASTAPPAHTRMMVRVPPGCKAGDTFSVQTPQGPMSVRVPAGTNGGDEMTVLVPAASTQPAGAGVQQRWRVTVPPGVGAGQLMCVKTADGAVLANVTVPPGATPGMQLDVLLPARAAAPTMRRVRASVPPGTGPGQQILVQIPGSGGLCMATVPPGVGPGATFDIVVPAASGAVFNQAPPVNAPRVPAAAPLALAAPLLAPACHKDLLESTRNGTPIVRADGH